jgi:hypothetical protein
VNLSSFTSSAPYFSATFSSTTTLPKEKKNELDNLATLSVASQPTLRSIPNPSNHLDKEKKNEQLVNFSSFSATTNRTPPLTSNYSAGNSPREERLDLKRATSSSSSATPPLTAALIKPRTNSTSASKEENSDSEDSWMESTTRALTSFSNTVAKETGDFMDMLVTVATSPSIARRTSSSNNNSENNNHREKKEESEPTAKELGVASTANFSAVGSKKSIDTSPKEKNELEKIAKTLEHQKKELENKVCLPNLQFMFLSHFTDTGG